LGSKESADILYIVNIFEDGELFEQRSVGARVALGYSIDLILKTRLTEAGLINLGPYTDAGILDDDIFE